MKEYMYNDFFNTLDKTGQLVINTINEYISIHYSDYKPFDIKPTDKEEREWKLDYRKKPKIGKAICNVYSIDGKISLRFSFLTSMVREFLIRQNDFTDKIKNAILRQTICVVNKQCRSYGGNISCQFRQHYWINERLIMTCPYPWIYLSDLNENDFLDLKLLIDLQMNNMNQDPKEIKGNTYAEVNTQRCKNIQKVNLDEIGLGTNKFETDNYVKKVKQFEKYISLYNLVFLGENNGLWFYQNNQTHKLNYTKNEYSHRIVPRGKYVVVLIEDPFTFSLNRVWNYICQWIKDQEEVVNGFILNNNDSTACLIKVFIKDLKEFMEIYVPIK